MTYFCTVYFRTIYLCVYCFALTAKWINIVIIIIVIFYYTYYSYYLYFYYSYFFVISVVIIFIIIISISIIIIVNFCLVSSNFWLILVSKHNRRESILNNGNKNLKKIMKLSFSTFMFHNIKYCSYKIAQFRAYSLIKSFIDYT